MESSSLEDIFSQITKVEVPNFVSAKEIISLSGEELKNANLFNWNKSIEFGKAVLEANPNFSDSDFNFDTTLDYLQSKIPKSIGFNTSQWENLQDEIFINIDLQSE